MSKLNRDILYYIFQDLDHLMNDDFINKGFINNKCVNSLHSCLFVNKLWCEVMIPILWSYPYNYAYKRKSLFNSIISHLSDNSINLLKDENIIETNFQKYKLSFNYIRFCKYLKDIDGIFPNKSRILREEIYKLFISECSTIKYLSADMLHYSIYEYPGSNNSLSNLYQLDCETVNQYFYRNLAQICRSIEKIKIIIFDDKLFGVAELIEMQKQIKYIFIDEFSKCKRISQALEKHANSIIYLHTRTRCSFLHLHSIFPKLTNLQYLIINGENNSDIIFEKYIINVGYCNLQTLELLDIYNLQAAINIIQNTNGNLQRVKIKLNNNYYNVKEYNQSIYKYCPNIKYVTVFLNINETLEELEKIFIKCQHLEIIEINERILNEYCDDFLKLLIKSSPSTLYKIRICHEVRDFNEETLKSFLTNWSYKGEKTLHLYCNYSTEWDNFIKDHKINGVFKCNEFVFWETKLYDLRQCVANNMPRIYIAADSKDDSSSDFDEDID
ncbi:hypothetical protein RclHR1_07530006 [Rhizophagus clarus]|uniref:F-box domain-containing protein n=1 Tax=Rhizophagus clarus TaxID=94130 RepID=A0A2Z6SL77_9GLOM|nr:hypothetical protein RclHR1_07530006 [Rhizophagus clarus]GES90947.1 hypothetical protein GLOIN_2v1790394 [Rhizophagus clarus]